MIKVAKIINTRGLKGECKLYLYTDEAADRFQKGSTLYLDKNQPVTVSGYSEYAGFGYLKLDGIDTIEKAQAIKNKTLYIEEDQLPDLEEGEYYYHQLTGSKVFNENGEDTGTVVDILETGANLVLRVQNENGNYLLPFVEAFVEDVDPQNKIIRIKEMKGLR